VRIAEFIVTPVAATDPPLRNSWGVHQPYCLRTIVQLRTDDGLEGVGETTGGAEMLAALNATQANVLGVDPWELALLRGSISEVRAFSAIEQACLDLIGKSTGRPVSDLLGGRCREHVEFSAYLFFKFDSPGGDEWGEVLTPEALVAEAQTFVSRYGFRALKLKGGVLPPDDEIRTLRLLRAALPDSPLRIDPNAIWSVDTSIRLGREIGHLLEYFEDPTLGRDGMAAVQRALSAVPLATNMCVTRWDEVRPGYDCGCVRVVLLDHHADWGGMAECVKLAKTCHALGWKTSMHSNNHLGVSMAAMVHLAAAIPNLDFACDTHYPWQQDDVIAGDRFAFRDGCLPVPTTPGLGVTIDSDKLGALHENALRFACDARDDTAEMRKYDPTWEAKRPRW